MGKEGKVRGNMTPVIGGASRIEIKGRRSGLTEAAMDKARRHGRLSVAGRRVDGKSWGVVAWETGVVWVTAAVWEIGGV